jgi:hypothetical protein
MNDLADLYAFTRKCAAGNLADYVIFVTYLFNEIICDSKIVSSLVLAPHFKFKSSSTRGNVKGL